MSPPRTCLAIGPAVKSKKALRPLRLLVMHTSVVQTMCLSGGTVLHGATHRFETDALVITSVWQAKP